MLVIASRIAALLCVVFCTLRASSADERQPRMGVFTRADARVDLSRSFTDSGGEVRTLKELLISGRPSIIVPVFYRCPRLCGMTISGVVDLVNHLPLALGSEYSVVVYSFNPADTVRDAAAKRVSTLARMRTKTVSSEAVRFLTATPDVITSMNSDIDFRVRYADKELEHSSAIFVVAPDGAVVRYFTGVEFDSVKVAQALREATQSGTR